MAFYTAISDNAVVNWGKGKNKDAIERLYPDKTPYNDLVSLPHPRWVMQYNRKSMDKWIDTYLKKLSTAHENNLSVQRSDS